MFSVLIFTGKKRAIAGGERKPPSLSHTQKKKTLSKKNRKQANSQPQGLAVAPVDQMHMNVGVLNNPISGSVYAPVGEHVGM